MALLNEFLKEKLQANREIDRLLGGSRVGCHKTDFMVKNLQKNFSAELCSSGEQKSILISLVLSTASAFMEYTKKSPIILLDEATSSLDTDSEEKVQNAIFNLTKNKTTLVIAHRLSTIKKADSIIVMKDGNIVGTGKHDELLLKSKDYENLYSKQVI